MLFAIVITITVISITIHFFFKYQAIVANDALNQLDIIIRRDYDSFSGFMLERYFERKLRESGRYTRIGRYWDRKGENEIDLIAVNEIEGFVFGGYVIVVLPDSFDV